MKRSIWVGFDPRETDAFDVAVKTARAHAPGVEINAISLAELRKKGLYWRPTSRRSGQLWDLISDAPMSTEFAVSRFMAPILAGSGLALFMDADVMIRADLGELFDIAAADPGKAVWCVQHEHTPTSTVKMDGQIQTAYRRKNWSSVCLWRCDHPALRALTIDLVNTAPGRDLHRFSFLPDDAIGALDPCWNHLVGERPANPQAKIAHFTLGTPDMPGYEACEFAEEWFGHLNAKAA